MDVIGRPADFTETDMQIYSCPACGGVLYFRNLNCSCGADLYFDPEQDAFLSSAKPCTNRAEISCNWVAEDEDGHCRSCRMTEVIPDTFRGDNLKLWSDAEFANRWVLTNLARWGWFTSSDMGARPRFHLLSEDTNAGHQPVIMGHADGLITINVIEADPAERAQRRQQMSERLRTIIAHFRHEIAHFLFIRLSERDGFVDRFRALYGDETADYGEALERHYENGAPDDFYLNYVTRYASSHPHEDWAETLAHVMHLTDILDSAAVTNTQTNGTPPIGYDAYQETNSEFLMGEALKLGMSLNHLNRSMGLQDIYPFVITPKVREKLIFAHTAIRQPPLKASGRQSRPIVAAG